MRLVAGIAVVILALSPLAYGVVRARGRRGADGRPRARASAVVEGLIVLAAAVLGVVIAVALLE